MGENFSCSTNCAPSCISRGHPPGHDAAFEDPAPLRKPPGKSYPVADPSDARLNWQTVAVRHAWKRAAEGHDRDDCADHAELEVVGNPRRTPFLTANGKPAVGYATSNGSQTKLAGKRACAAATVACDESCERI
mmetsp:Transcript_88305/g.248674  ORF Transcript_88305/g.248674 Transcript_88305/m.248674 type:complete len:134 (-) Transcript_88305:154-555(-)